MLAVAICNIWAQAESSLSLSGGHFYPPTPLWGSLWEPDEDRHPAADDYLGLEEGAWSIKQGLPCAGAQVQWARLAQLGLEPLAGVAAAVQAGGGTCLFHLVLQIS